MLRSLFTSDRPSETEVLLTLERNPQVARHCADVVVKSLKALKGNANFVRYAINRFIRATKVIQRLVRRFTLGNAAILARAVEQWNIYEMRNTPQGSPKVDMEVKYLLLRAEYVRQRASYRMSWHTWRKQLIGLEVQLEMAAQDKGGAGSGVSKDRMGFLRIRHQQLKAKEPKFSFIPNYTKLSEDVIKHQRKTNCKRVEKAMGGLGFRVSDPEFINTLAAQYEAVVAKQKREVVKMGQTEKERSQSKSPRKPPSEVYFCPSLRRLQTLRRKETARSAKSKQSHGTSGTASPFGISTSTAGSPLPGPQDSYISGMGVTESMVFESGEFSNSVLKRSVEEMEMDSILNGRVHGDERHIISDSAAKTCKALGIEVSEVVKPLEGAKTDVDGEVHLYQPEKPKAVPAAPHRTYAKDNGPLYPSFKHPQVRPPLKGSRPASSRGQHHVDLSRGPLTTAAAEVRAQHSHSVGRQRPQSGLSPHPLPKVSESFIVPPHYPYSRHYARDGAEERADLLAREEHRLRKQPTGTTVSGPGEEKRVVKREQREVWTDGKRVFPTASDVVLSGVTLKALCNFVSVPLLPNGKLGTPKPPAPYSPPVLTKRQNQVRQQQLAAAIGQSSDKKLYGNHIPVKPFVTLTGHSSSVCCLCFITSPDGDDSTLTFLASGSHDGTARVWNMETGDCVCIEYHKDRVSQLVCTSKYLCTGSDDNTIHVLATNSHWECLSIFQHKSWISTLMGFGGVLVSGGFDCKVSVWDLDKRKQMHHFPSIHTQSISALCRDEQGSMLITASMDGTARIIQNALYQRHLTDEEAMFINSKRGIPSYSEHRGPILALERIRATTFVTASGDGNVHVWEAVARELNVLMFVDCQMLTKMVLLRPNMVMCSCRDGSNKVFNLTTGAFMFDFATKGVNFGAAECSGNRCLLANSDGVTWVANSLAGMTTHALIGHASSVNVVETISLPANLERIRGADYHHHHADVDAGMRVPTPPPIHPQVQAQRGRQPSDVSSQASEGADSAVEDQPTASKRPTAALVATCSDDRSINLYRLATSDRR